MIYTVTCNPSLDYVVTVPNFAEGYTNRCTEAEMFPGGKGINVSMVLQNLGHPSVALGFLAGFVGEEIEKSMDITGDFVKIQEGNSRINVKIKNLDGTEINGIGPDISPENLGEFMEKIEKLKPEDVLVLAGSIPKSLGNDFYEMVMEKVACQNIVVDATGDLLLASLKHKPFLIKPNAHEMAEIFHCEINTPEEIMEYAKKLQEKGARNVLVSMGRNGAMLLDESGAVHNSPVPKGTLVNAVGAGDSMVAGFLAGYLEKKEYHHAFIKSVATGSGSAFSQHFATKELVETLMEQLS
ncbi:MAG: 1-phosphofructokinase [Eubacteriales bacterium]